MKTNTTRLTLGSFTLALWAFVLSPTSAQVGIIYTPTGVYEDITNLPPAPPPPPSGPQAMTQAPGDRRVYFLHGLTGNEGAWTDAAAFTNTAYKVETKVVDWNAFQNGGLESASSNVESTLMDDRSVIQNANMDPSQSFTIAHSMGGLAGREVMRQYRQKSIPSSNYKTNGLITFATPHAGARVINSLPQSQSLFSSGCADLLAGPVAQKLDADAGFVFGWLLNLTGINAKVKEITTSLCKVAAPQLGDIFITQKFVNPAGLDIAVGTAFMTRLNANDPAATMPRGTVFSAENEPVLWRLLASQMQDVNSFPTFGAASDGMLVTSVNKMVRDYEAKQQENLDKANGFWVWFKKEEYRQTAEKWRKGAWWLRNVNGQWRTIIGADEMVVRYESWRCNCPTFSFPAQSYQSCLSAGCDAQFIDKKVDYLQRDNDGVVTTESAT